MSLVRTTLNLDDDIVDAARSVAAAEGRSLGEVVSDLARRGLAPRAIELDDENGFPVFAVRPDAASITPDMVRAALDEH